MNIMRGSEYVRQQFMDFDMVFSGIWSTEKTVTCHAIFDNKTCLLVIPRVSATMTASGVVTAKLTDSALYPLYDFSNPVDAYDGSVNAYKVPGEILIDIQGNISLRPLAAVYSGANLGGWDNIFISYPSQNTFK